MIRVLEFPEGVKPRSMSELAKENPDVAIFLRRMGSLVMDGFDLDRLGSLEEFNKRSMFPLCHDVRLQR